MKFEAFDKCILCLKNECDSEEHIIPKCIGGKFKARFLCKKCNSNYGKNIISSIKKDPIIRSAINRLRERIPELYSRFENGQLYETKDENGNRIKLRKKGNKMIVLPLRLPDDSFIFDSSANSNNIRNMLDKEGVDRTTQNQILLFIERSAKNLPIKIGKDSLYTFLALRNLIPCFDNMNLIDFRVPCLMAYEFLALSIGKNIYDHDYDFIRNYISDNTQNKRISIQRFMDRNERGAHYICIEFHTESAVIKIKLFNGIVYQVDLIGVSIDRPNYVLMENLVEGKTYFSQLADAKKGIWTCIN